MTLRPDSPAQPRWVALDTELTSLRSCRTVEELTDHVATLAVQACGAAAIALGHFVGSEWLPWLRAGDLGLLESLAGIPSSSTDVGALPGVDQRVIRTHEAGRRQSSNEHHTDIVVAAVGSAGTTLGLMYVVGNRLNVEIVECYANALGAVLDLIRVRQRAQRQRYVLARLRGAVAERLEQPIELISEVPHPANSRATPAHPRPNPTALRERLTDRQREVLDLMMAGLTNAQIAEQLVVALPTVKSHVRVLLRISGSVNRAEALARFSRRS